MRTRALAGSLAAVAAAVACALPATAATTPAATAATAPATGAATTPANGAGTTPAAGPGSSPSADGPAISPPDMTTPAAGPAATSTGPSKKIVWVNKHTIGVGGHYSINPDGFHESMTLANVGYGNNFTVAISTPATGRVLAFPDFLFGCSWGVCSPHRTLPVQISRDGDPGASVSTGGQPKGQYNAAFDIWLELKPYLSGQPHGAEIMIWPRETANLGSLRGSPEVRIDGALYYEIAWRAGNTHGTWNYVQFRKVSQSDSLRGIHLNDFFKAAEARGWVSPRWYIQSITAGFEIWSGGEGLEMDNFWARS
jgi:hypothetical protein